MALSPSTATSTSPRDAYSLHVRYLVALVLICVVSRALYAWNMVGPARDAFRFMTAAQLFEDQPFLQAVKSMEVHPLYPWTYMLSRQAYMNVTGDDGPYSWYYSGQIWSVVCYSAFLSFAYAAGCVLWRPAPAFWGCVAIALAPRQLSYSVDVLSDSLHGACWMASFALLAWAWNDFRAWKAALSGAFAGLAYLTRIEAILLPLTMLSALAATQLWPAWRWPWRQALWMLLAYGAPLTLLAGGYMALIGAVSPRASARVILGSPPHPAPPLAVAHPLRELGGDDVRKYAATAVTTSAVAEALAEPVETALEPGEPVNIVPRPYTGVEGYDRLSLPASSLRLVYEVGQESRGWLMGLALLALVIPWHSATRMPAGSLALFACAGNAAMLVLLQMKAGYLCGRYLTPTLPLLSMYAMTGAEAFIAVVQRLPRFPWERSWLEPMVERRRQCVAVGILTIVATALCSPAWIKPLHRYRYGHMEAARWLAQHSRPDDVVFDPTAFSSFFANRKQWAPVGDVPPQIPARYATIDPSMVYKMDDVTHRAIAKVNAEGRLIRRFPRHRESGETGIYLFELPTATAAHDQGRQPPQ